MPVAQANALVAGLAVADADPEADTLGLMQLATRAARRFSPIAAPDAPDGIVIDATGCAHLFGGDETMLGLIARRLARAGIAARAAIADTLGAAHGMARFGEANAIAIVAPGETAAALAPLPVAALRVDPGIAAELRRFGLKRVGQLLVAPRAPLVLRFGDDLIRRLDQALGHAAEPIAAVTPKDAPRCRAQFLDPVITSDGLAHATGRLVAELAGVLSAQGLGARRLDLIFERVDRTTVALRAGLARPSRDPKHLMKLLMERLDSVDLGFGVGAMTLIASIAAPLDARQLAAQGMNNARDETGLAEMIDGVSNLSRTAAVYAVQPIESHVPERTVRRADPLAAPVDRASWPAAWPRPFWLFAPEPVETMALLPDAPPARFTWRGRPYRVRKSDGPERIHLEWWRAASEIRSVRDYYRVEDESGGRFWLFREGRTNEARWYLHGVCG